MNTFVHEANRRGDIPDHLIFIVRGGSLTQTRRVAAQLHTCFNANIRSQYHIIYVPTRTISCEQILEEECVLSHVSVRQWSSLGIIPLDSDILSLEMNSVFRQVVLYIV